MLHMDDCFECINVCQPRVPSTILEHSFEDRRTHVESEDNCGVDKGCEERASAICECDCLCLAQRAIRLSLGLQEKHGLSRLIYNRSCRKSLRWSKEGFLNFMGFLLAVVELNLDIISGGLAKELLRSLIERMNRTWTCSTAGCPCQERRQSLWAHQLEQALKGIQNWLSRHRKSLSPSMLEFHTLDPRRRYASSVLQTGTNYAVSKENR